MLKLLYSVVLVLLLFTSYSKADPTKNELTISDDSYAEVPLDFSFPYFGNNYTNSYMFSNGVVGFLNPSSNSGLGRHMCCNGLDLNNIPTSSYYSGTNLDYFIMPFWTDLIKRNSVGGKFFEEGDESYQKYYWEDISEYGQNSRTNTFDLTIKPDGGIMANYLELDVANHSVTIGATGDVSEGETHQFLFHNRSTDGDLSFTFNSNQNDPAWMPKRDNFYYQNEDGELYTINPCDTNPLHSTSCSGYAAAYALQQYNLNCTANPLYDEGCTGYDTAYFNQQCGISPLYNTNCTGYAAAYLTQQCTLDPLYDSECDGYGAAYTQLQCSLNTLYDESCTGYDEAYLTQQCSYNPLYDEDCTGYDIAYFNQQCSYNPQYDVDCPGYIEPMEELEEFEVFDIEPETFSVTNTIIPLIPTLIEEIPLPEIITVEETIEPEVEINTEIEQEIEFEIAALEETIIEEEPIVEEENENSTEDVSEDQEETNEVSETSENIEESENEETVQESDSDGEESVDDSSSVESSDKEERSSKDSSNSGKKLTKKEKLKKILSDKLKSLASDMGNAASLEQQKQIQNQVLALINYKPDFKDYFTSLPGGYYPDSSFYVTNQMPDSRKGLRNGLANQILHNKLVDMQYK